MLADGCVLKCRRCRLLLVNGRSVVGSHGGGDTCPMESLSTLWYISDNEIPDWIQEQIIQVHWTKGRLLCPKCAGRLGSFDFVSLVKCPCGDQVFPPIHIQRCRVDMDKVSPKHTPKTQQGEKLPLKLCETKEQACGILTSEHFAGSKKGVVTTGKGDTHIRTGDTHTRTGDASARTGEAHDGTGDAPARSRTAVAPADTDVADDGPAEMDSSLSEGQLGSTSGSTSSTVDEEGSEGDQILGTSVSWQRPLVFAEDDDSCIHDTNLFQVLEGLDGGNTGNAADRRRSRRQRKRDMNKLKNIRKKQRRHEKWLKKQTQEEERFEETERFEEAEREGLVCPICLDLYYEPYLCQPCGHVFCDPCLRQIAKDNPSCTACPLCRTVVITVNYSYELSKTMQDFFPRHHESRRRAERQSRYKSWPLPGVTGARALWWTTVTSLMSRRGGRNYPHYRSNDDDLNYDGSMFDELLVYFFSINWIIGLFVVCGLCYLSIRSFIF